MLITNCILNIKTFHFEFIPQHADFPFGSHVDFSWRGSATLYRTCLIYSSFIHYSSLTLNAIKSEKYFRFGDCLVIFGYLSGINEALMSSLG